MIVIGMKRFGMRMWVCLLVAFTIDGAALAQTPSPNEKKTISITWLGHAAFEIVSPGGTRLLIDPFLAHNPATPQAFKDLKRYKPAAILVSHSHSDHSADAVEIAKATGAPGGGTFDYVGGLGLPEPQAIVPMHFATFPALATEADVRAALKDDARLKIMKPGETRKF